MNHFDAQRHSPIESQVCPSALTGFIGALLALGLALLGTYSPWGALRFPLEQKLTGIWALVGYGGTFVLPIFLGLGSALLGGYSMKMTELSQGKLYGEGLAVFSMFLGLFAFIIGVVCTFAALIWPYL